jgi:hypothetical protein
MSNKQKKRARRVFKRTVKTVTKLTRSAGPVIAGIAAGLATRDVAGGESYLGEVGKELSKLLRTLGSRATAAVQGSGAENLHVPHNEQHVSQNEHHA